jgi:Tol biopolymer transport system component
VDHRTDQFSLGVTLYEMLAGQRPFRGATAAETLTAILREEPEPLSVLAPSVPAPVRWLVERCLAKEPAQRYDSTRDLARELSTLGLHLSDARLATASATQPREGGRDRRLRPGAVAAVVAFAVLATAAVTTALGWGLGRPSPPTRFEIRLPDGHYLSQYRQPFAFSPDGRLLVYSAFTWKTPFLEQNPPQLFLRPLDSFEARPIPGTEGGVQPVFSPDGKHVAFAASAEKRYALRRVPVAGGAVSTVCESDIPFGLAWSADGFLYFAEELGPLLRVPATSGTPEAITKLDVAGNEVSHRLPHFLPDGRTLLYTSLRWTTLGPSWKKARVFAGRVGETGRSLVADWASDARWAPPGHVLFAREGRLYAAPFDAKSLSLGGAASPILESVSHSIWTSNSARETGAAMVDVAGGGLVAWVNGGVTPPEDGPLVWVDASGKETPVDLPQGPFLGGRLSPDGGTLLVQYGYPTRQLEVLDLARGARRDVTFGMNPGSAVWGPGPGRITFASDHEGPWRIYSRRVDAGSEEVETLWQGEGSPSSSPGAWSRDGRVLAFTVFDMKTGHDIWLLERGKGARPLVASQFREVHPDISPDGRWLVYTSNEPGRAEIFVRPLEGDGASEQVSAGGGVAPIWSGNGSAILYWSLAPGGGRPGLFRVRFGFSAKGLSLGRPEKLLEARYVNFYPGRPWDLAPDGRVLIVKDTDPEVQRTWFEKALGDRIRVDLGGLPALLEETGKGP